MHRHARRNAQHWLSRTGGSDVHEVWAQSPRMSAWRATFNGARDAARATCASNDEAEQAGCKRRQEQGQDWWQASQNVQAGATNQPAASLLALEMPTSTVASRAANKEAIMTMSSRVI